MVAMAQGVYHPPVSGVPVGRLIRKACIATYGSLKEPAIVMGWDEATFSRALHGLAPMDLCRLACLSPRWWFRFCRVFIAAKLQAWEADTLDARRVS